MRKKLNRYPPFSLYLVFAILGLYYLTLIGRFNLNIFTPESMGGINAHVWQRFIEGFWDVDPTDGGFELYLHEGRYYVYFGFFPTLVRGLLTLFYPTSVHLERLELLIPALLWIVGIYLMIKEFALLSGKRAFLGWTLLIVLAIGSPIVYILTPAHVYHIAIIWSVGLAAIYNWYFVRFVLRPNTRTLSNFVILGILAGMITLSRATLGISAFLLLAILGVILVYPQFKKSPLQSFRSLPSFSIKQLAVIAVVWIISGSATLFVNYKRFGNAFTTMPLEEYILFSNGAGEFNVRGKEYLSSGTMRLDCIIPQLEFYFWPHGDNFVPVSPYFLTSKVTLTSSFARYLDNREATIPLTLSAPVLLLLTLISLFNWKKPWGNPDSNEKNLFSLVYFVWLVPILFLISYWAACLRYTVDFLPFLTLGSCLALYQIKGLKNSIIDTMPFKLTIVALALTSVFVVHSTYLIYAITNILVPPQDRDFLASKFTSGIQFGPPPAK